MKAAKDRRQVRIASESKHHAGPESLQMVGTQYGSWEHVVSSLLPQGRLFLGHKARCSLEDANRKQEVAEHSALDKQHGSVGLSYLGNQFVADLSQLFNLLVLLLEGSLQRLHLHLFFSESGVECSTLAIGLGTHLSNFFIGFV